MQQPKTQTDKKETKDNRANVNDNLITNQRENTKGYKSDKEQRPYKEITDHRAHDRKSGTGRVYSFINLVLNPERMLVEEEESET